MNTTNATARFPERVYRHVSDEPVELAGGEHIPPFTRDVVERIAETKPAWADFEDTDINNDTLTANPSLREVAWCKSFGDVDVFQDTRYTHDGNMVDADAPYIQSWTEKFDEPTDAFMHAANLEDAGRFLYRIIEGAGD